MLHVERRTVCSGMDRQRLNCVRVGTGDTSCLTSNACFCPSQDIVIPVMVTSQGFHLSPLNPLVAQQAKQRGDHRRPGTFFFAVGALLWAVLELQWPAQAVAVF